MLIASALLSMFLSVNAAETVMSLEELNTALSSGGEVTLGSDIEGAIVIPENAEVTLNLAGFELKSADSDTISNHGKLTITGNGKITANGSSKGAIVNYAEGNVTIDGATIYAESWYAIKNMGAMKIVDANVTKGTNGASVIANGWYGSAGTDRNTTGVEDTAKLTIEGGNFEGEGKSSTVIKNDDYGILVVNGGTLTSSSDITDINAGPVILNWHDTTINGGTFTSTNGAVLADGYLSDEADKGVMTINGGTFVSETGAGILAINGGATNGKGSLEIKNGNFSGIVGGELPYTTTIKGGKFSNSVDESLLDESLKVELKSAKEENYPYSYYATKEEALANAEVGDEIDGEVVEAPKEYTLIFKDGYTENDEGEKVSVKEGDEVTAPTLTRDGYDFVKWSPEVPEKFEVQKNEDGSEVEEYVFTAEWKKKTSSSGGGKKDDEPKEEEWKNPYEDIKEDKWYFESVKKATEAKLFNGMTASEFMPEEGLTRGMAVTVLYRLSGAEEKEVAAFDDVAKDAYYSNAIAWAAKNKIVLGVGDNKFSPDELVSRQDLATMVYRYAKLNEKGYEDGKVLELNYADKAEIADYAIEPISWCTTNKIIEGKDENKVDAKGTATRAEAAKIFVALAEKMKA